MTSRIPTVARILLGLIFLLMGLNGFFMFLPQPKTPMSEGAIALFMAFVNTHYLLPLIAGTQVLVAVLLLANRFVPLALALIAPVIVNIILFHVFLAPSGLPLGLVVLVLEVYLAWAYRTAFAPMLAQRVTPG